MTLELNMKAVMRQTGLSADCLRIWEKRYGAVRPRRATNGRRIYSESELQRLKLLATLVGRDLAIGKIANLSDEELLRQIGNYSQTHATHGTQLKDLIENLHQFDLKKIRATLALLRLQTSPRVFAFEIVPQVMMLVGKKINSGEFSIAQEHAISEIFQGHLKRIYEDLAPLENLKDMSQGTFLFCTRDGDPHDFGLLIAAIAVRANGLQTHYVGRSLPADALAHACRKVNPQAIVLGMATLPKSEEKISPQAYLESIHRTVDPEVEFWIGGSGAQSIRRKKLQRSLFIFESISDLEDKLKKITGA